MPAEHLRSGRVLSDAELALAASEALDAEDLTQTGAAKRLGVKPHAVSMALNPAKYPGRGQALRVRLVELAGFTVEPAFRLSRRASDGTE